MVLLGVPVLTKTHAESSRVPERWRQVEGWRRRAEEIRTAAESFAVPSAKETMLRVARNYERLADDLERRLRPQPDAKPETG